jgi:hypothetical protein
VSPRANFRSASPALGRTERNRLQTTNSSDFCNNHSREVGECPQEGLAVTNTIMKSEIERRRHRRAVNTLGRLAFTTLGPPLFLISYLVVATTTAHAETVSGSLFLGGHGR